ncbi:hypothetical protein EVG20_g412 [Dentipellis fragilis]|uniref:Zn(2)-C6 fungal-type domain-containing protein n=1 Tax=Dentipellis fragilis TaxID=205917 RepID=A0A4Y9ZFP1_9AGAM|nr:hypothetical protein EVG20_g412 [Dentipellis fragilis]
MTSFAPHLCDSYQSSSSMPMSVSPKQDDLSSRMRCHKGNKPSLPQTKHCPLCPAKFTRTTHLNRHLRTHSNERLHRCDTCLSEFTRSDLLTRHKRSCGDLLNQNKSRRKSCQACAESKVKCDLKEPCTKCISRGRECIFINDPKASRDKKAAAAARKRANSLRAKSVASDASPITSPGAASPANSSEGNLPSASAISNAEVEASTSRLQHTSQSSTFDLSSEMRPALDSIDTAAFPELSACTTSSSPSMSPRSDAFDFPADLSFGMGSRMDALGDSLAKVMPADVMDPFTGRPLPLPDMNAANMANFFWGDMQPAAGETSLSSLSIDLIDAQPFMASTSPTYPPQHSGAPPLSTASIPVSHSCAQHGSSTPVTASVPDEPPETELQHYLYLFFSAFSHHLSILHAPTWTPEGKPPVLIRAMQACGALFVRTRIASAFVSNTLTNIREILIHEVAKNPSDSEQQAYLILACLLLQVIGLFHQPTDQAATSNIYHGMVIMMIRRCGLIQKCSNWTPPSLSDPASIDAAWRDWSRQETIKRALMLAYLHDTCHCVFFSLPPSFFESEVDLCLPTEDALWNAKSAQEWFETLQRPAPYGSTSARLRGYSMQHAISNLSDSRVSSVSLAVSPFSHFILIHAILRSIYTIGLEMPTSRPPSPRPEATSPMSANSPDGGRMDGQILALQAVLQKWLHSWLNAPDASSSLKGPESFMQNALPYFWLAQVSLLAFQQGVPPIGCPRSCTPEARHRVLRQWLHHIRDFLRQGRAGARDALGRPHEDGRGQQRRRRRRAPSRRPVVSVF